MVQVDPLHQRERFAAQLRTDRKSSILQQKRQSKQRQPPNRPFLRVRADLPRLNEALLELNIHCDFYTDSHGLFKNTIKVFTHHGEDVPRILRFLREHFEKKDAVWEPFDDHFCEQPAQQVQTMHPFRPMDTVQHIDNNPPEDVQMHDTQPSIPPEPTASSTDELPAAVLPEDQ